MEIWLQLADAPSYSVSDLGRFKNNITGQVLIQKIDKYGYPCITYTDALGNKRFRTIHRIVAETFIPFADFKLQVNHKDGNKLNNSLSNLEWVTVSENIIHSYENRLNTNTTHLTLIDLRTGKETFFRSLKDLSRKLGIYSSTLSPLILNSHRNHILGRYAIRLKDEAFLDDRSNTVNFGKKVFIYDELSDICYEYPSVMLAAYKTGLRCLSEITRSGKGYIRMLGYQAMHDTRFLTPVINLDREQTLEAREKYLLTPYNPRPDYYVVYDYYSKEEKKFQKLDEVVNYLNGLNTFENKIAKSTISYALHAGSSTNRTGIVRGYGVKDSNCVIDWTQYDEEVLISGRLGLAAPNAVYRVFENGKSEILIGHKALCERIGYRYDRPWPTFSLVRESRFFNLPNLRVERLNKPIPE